MPEIRNPNLQSQGPGGGGGSGGDMRCTHDVHDAFDGRVPGLSVLFQQADAASDSHGYADPDQQAQRPGSPAGQPRLGRQRLGRRKAQTAAARAPTPTIAASLETQTTIENEQYKIVFTNRGAQIEHWILKKYSDSAGKPLDMVQPQLAEGLRVPAFVLYL